MSDNKIFDRERMEKALSGEIYTTLEDMSREETRNFIEAVAFLNMLEEDIDSGKISVIPDSVWERVNVIKDKAAETKKRKRDK